MLLHKLRAANGLSQCSSSFNILSRTHRPLSSWDGGIQLQVNLIPWVNACSLTWSMCGYITRKDLMMLALTKAAQAFRAITCLLWSLYINDLCDWPAGVKLQRSHIYTGLSSEYSTITLSSRLLILTSVSSCVEVRLYSFIRMWNSRHFLPCVKLFPARWNCPCLHFLQSILSDSGIYIHTDILENNINFSHLNAYNKQQTF